MTKHRPPYVPSCLPHVCLSVCTASVCLSRQTPSSSSSSGSSARRGSRSSKSKHGTEREAPASDAAKEVARRLGVSVAAATALSGRPRRRVPVTVCVNDVSRPYSCPVNYSSGTTVLYCVSCGEVQEGLANRHGSYLHTCSSSCQVAGLVTQQRAMRCDAMRCDASDRIGSCLPSR